MYVWQTKPSQSQSQHWHQFISIHFLTINGSPKCRKLRTCATLPNGVEVRVYDLHAAHTHAREATATASYMCVLRFCLHANLRSGRQLAEPKTQQ